MASAAEVLSFWFGDLRADGTVDAERAALWWKQDPLTDETIRQRFEPLVRQASTGARDSWAETAEGRLALILCLDQFPRNLYRQDPRSWAFDPLAQRLCLEGLERGHDQQLPPIQRVFHYLPLEHAEDRDLQQRSLALFAQLHAAAPPALKEACAAYLAYAEQHKAIVDRFGRFPHRNQVLGRASTAEEMAFLEQPGSSF